MAVSQKGIPLAHGFRLNHGQIIGPAPTIATRSTKAKRSAPEPIAAVFVDHTTVEGLSP
jgi:hypothetical protein